MVSGLVLTQNDTVAASPACTFSVGSLKVGPEALDRGTTCPKLDAMARLSEAAAVRRLLDRFGFGAGGAELAAAQQRGWSSTLTALLAPVGPDRGVTATPPPAVDWLPRPRHTHKGGPALKAWRTQARQQQTELVVWWLDRMAAARAPLRERMTWLWHGHFATSSQKVHSAFQLYTQNDTLRSGALGRFSSLAQALVIDPAMLVWLDGNDNRVGAPNENLSREFMELFTLGQGHYRETDVKQAARALTGWVIQRDTGRAAFRPRRHDTGAKTVLGTSADLDAAAFVDLVLAQPAASNFVAERVWFRLGSGLPLPAAGQARLVAAYGPERDISALLRAVATEPAFGEESTALVKSPVEWLVGLLRATGVRVSELRPQQQHQLLAALRGMGQVPFAPPSVGGWPSGASWLTTAAALSRLHLARLVTGAASLPADLTRTSPGNRPEAIRRLLGVDRMTARTGEAVTAVGAQAPLAVAVAACAPEYVVSA